MASTRRSVAEAAGLVWHAGPIRAVCYAVVTFVQAGLPVAVAWLTKLVLDDLVRGAAAGDLLALLVPLVMAGVAMATLPQLATYIGAEMGRRGLGSNRGKSNGYGSDLRGWGLAAVPRSGFSQESPQGSSNIVGLTAITTRTRHPPTPTRSYTGSEVMYRACDVPTSVALVVPPKCCPAIMERPAGQVWP
jgi:hypothetical protein